MADDHPTTDPDEDEYGKVERAGADREPPEAVRASPDVRVEDESFAHANDDD
jgi:hypothetical protein